MKNIPFEEHLTELENPNVTRKRAVIREPECIGCTKCIDACPVDAILGGAKQMHTVIEFDCTGCELCVAPCPVDCIDIVTVTEKDSAETRQDKLKQFQNQYARHSQRQNNLKQKISSNHKKNIPQTIEAKKAYIQAALARVTKT